MGERFPERMINEISNKEQDIYVVKEHKCSVLAPTIYLIYNNVMVDETTSHASLFVDETRIYDWSQGWDIHSTQKGVKDW